MVQFTRATRKASRFRIGLEGPSGSGKTMIGLRIATVLAKHDNGRVALIDSERGSSAKYSDGRPFDFDIAILEEHSPQAYIDALVAAEAAGFPVIVIDSASHEWKGTLKLVDQASQRMQGNSWAGWSKGRPAHESFVEAMVNSHSHIVATFRNKQETAQRRENGKTIVDKLGLAPVTSDDMDYEFDVWGSISHDGHSVVITKTRIDTIASGSEWPEGVGLAEAYLAWLGDAAYADEGVSEERLKADLRKAATEAALKPSEITAVVGDPGAIAWLRAHNNDVKALIAEAQRVASEKAEATA